MQQRSERRMVGLFSLTIGAVLLVLILLRGQQAAREGNQELRNDTYWVLVSPLVFAGFGVYLLRHPGRSGSGRRPFPAPFPEPLSPPPQLQRSIQAARREAEQGQQDLASAGAVLDRSLMQARQDLASAEARAAQSERDRERASDQSRARMAALEEELARIRQQHSSSQQELLSATAAGDQRLHEARQAIDNAERAAKASEQQLRQSAAAAQERIAGLEAQLEGMRQSRNRAETDLQELLHNRATVSHTSLDQATALRQRLEKLTGDLEQRLVQAHGDQSRVLTAQQAELERLQHQLLSATAAAATAREQASAATSALEGRLNGLDSQLHSLALERDALRQALLELGRNGPEASAQALAAAEAARAELRDLLGQLSSQQSDLQQGLEQFLLHEQNELAQTRSQLQTSLEQLELAHAREAEASATTGNRLQQLDQEIQQAQQAGQRSSDDMAAAISGLTQTRSELEEGLQSGRQTLAALAEQVDAQLVQARDRADRALQMSQDAQARVEGFLQTADRQTASQQAVSQQTAAQQNVASAGPDPVQASYAEACAEIGVLPGSDWIVVRATWRRNLKQWHPDQGGDAQRWNRRHAAYQLLSAWYDFHGAT